MDRCSLNTINVRLDMHNSYKTQKVPHKVMASCGTLFLELLKFNLRTSLLISFGIPKQVFFSKTRHKKQSLASLNEHFGNAVAEKKTKLGNKMELLGCPYARTSFSITTFPL